MIHTGNKSHFAIITVLLVLLGGVLSACAVGPFEIGFRGTDSLPQANLTVTAVFATNTQIAALRTSTAVAAPPVAIQQATLPPVTAAPPASTRGLQLVFSPDSFTLVNSASRPLDIAGLSFHSDAGEMAITEWDNGYLTASLYSFPADDCLMAWGLGSTNQPKPAGCRTRHAWLAVNSSQVFWQTSGAISVRWYGQPIAVCAATSGSCEIDLP